MKTINNISRSEIVGVVKRAIIGRDEEIARAFFIRNTDKLLLGIDSGWWSLGKDKRPMPEFALIDDFKLPREVEDKVDRKNAERLFRRSKPGSGLPSMLNKKHRQCAGLITNETVTN